MILFGILKDEKFLITTKEDFVEVQNLFHNLLFMKNNNEATKYIQYQLVKIEVLEGEY